MSQELTRELKENHIVVVQIRKSDYAKKLGDVVLVTSRVFREICYVSLNRPYKMLLESFKEKGVDTSRIVFIDAISGEGASGGKNVISVSSPKALTEISIEMSNLLKKDTESFVFDSLSTLLIYEDSSTAIKFVHSIVSKVGTANKSCVFVVLKEDSGTEMMKDVNMFVDKVVAF